MIDFFSLERLYRNLADYPGCHLERTRGIFREDLSLRSRQGFLAEPALSIAEGLEMTRVVKRYGTSAIVTESLMGEE